VGGEQLDDHLTAREQELRIQVGVAGPDPEVQPVAGRTQAVALAEALTGGHLDAREERVAGPEPVGVAQGHVECAGHVPGEHDGPVAARPHRRARHRGVLEAPVAGPIRRGRRAERVGDGRVDWRDVGGWRIGRGCAGGHDRQDDHDHTAVAQAAGEVEGPGTPADPVGPTSPPST
jgi:hypothetical protein